MKDLILKLGEFYYNNVSLSALQAIVGVVIAFSPALLISAAAHIKYGN